MKLYRFSPIKTKEELINAITYVVTQTSELCKKVVGEVLPISSLTIFAHYPDEYDRLTRIAFELGTLHDENNGPRVRLHRPLSVGNNKISYLRIRRPDPYRMHVGCNDFDVEDYQSFKSKYLSAHPKNLRLIERPDYEMIEFFDPDYDVLAYVVSNGHP